MTPATPHAMTRPRPPRRRLRAPVRDAARRLPESGREGGSASIQMVFLLPVMFSMMFLGMQAALYYHARTVAIAAAQEGARAAAAETGTTSHGTRAALNFVADAGGDDVLTAVAVTGARTATTATVTVRGRSLNVIPGWSPLLEQSATAPVERLTR
ncbi:pilus assembly protein [Intrasporangium calvum]|uniref:Pilus assembly protein n=1 Tax=Intrasporangium calvum TaxID=53358 RepID=A0ABT5GK62_9MICO|nr:TadE/TadG family type IV pilus assembly protein [Intrasporangium calvum]MDC5698071.1 pilus assembly protein [Intrasporangium calvum]